MLEEKPKLSDFSAHIKNVYIELKGYEFFHSPYSHLNRQTDERDGRFIGRETVRNKIKMVLKNSKTQAGAYLVAGFRGMGKTSVVRMAVDEYNSEISLKNYKTYRKEKFWYNCLFFLIHLILLSTDSLYGTNQWVNHFLSIFLLVSFSLCVYNAYQLWWGANTIDSMLSSAPLTNQSTPPPYDKSRISLNFINLFQKLFLLLSILLFCYSVPFFTEILPDFSKLIFGGDWSQIISKVNWSFSGFLLLLKLLVFTYLALCLVVLLINGLFRFSFKESLVKNKWSKEGEYVKFEINLSQEDVNEIDILRRVTIELLQFWKKIQLNRWELVSIPLFQPFIFFLKILFVSRANNPSYTNILNLLILLGRRLDAEVTSEQKFGLSPNLTVGTMLPIGRFNTPLGNFSKNEKVSYPIANAKEIEDELVGIFEKIERLRRKSPDILPHFLFIIDELDKIAPNRNPRMDERELADPSFDDGSPMGGTRSQRKRQEAVGNLLANLKGFLNVVSAKFIFIGGRELYDASLADIADRDSFYSSIFNQVIYVNSFFKDKTGKRAGITQMAEHYLCKLILSDLNEKIFSDKEETQYNLNTLYNKLEITYENNIPKISINKETNNSEKVNDGKEPYLNYIIKYKIIFLLQSYIVYLTYRSNGTPKKLATLTEKIIREVDIESLVESNTEDLIVTQKDRDKKKSMFMAFKYDFQYEVGLTANIYRPYIIINSRHLKTLGDKLLFSSSFIFDHIIKFHAFGYSWRNLELIPEVILVNKEPNLRAYIEELMRFLLRTHVRNTVSGIYQYTFYNKVKTELKYLSKISDLSAAAFNFTLDESLQIKRHYKRKLSDLESKYKNYKSIEGDNNYVHSIGFVQGILGDLHFYDKEYDEALVYYIEAMEPLRLPFIRKVLPVTRHQFFNWLRNKLKAGLTLEKMREFNSAFSYYATLCKDIPYFLDKIVYPEDVMHRVNSFRNMQLICMPFVAHLGVIEKYSADGITFLNLVEKEKELRHTINLEKKDQVIGNYNYKFTTITENDYFRKFLLLADYYNNVGSILFYKNNIFPMLFKNKYQSIHKLPDYIKEAISDVYENRKKKISKKNETGEFITNDKLYARGVDYQPSLSAYVYYYQAARYLSEYHRKRLFKLAKRYKIKLKSNDVIGLLPLYLLPESKDFINSERYYYIANVISKLGDTILSGLTIKERDSTINLKDIRNLNLVQNNKGEGIISEIKSIAEEISKIGKKNQPLFSLKLVFDLYQLAGAFYLRSGREQSYGYQYRKILYVIRDVFANQLEDFNCYSKDKTGKTTKLNFDFNLDFENTLKSIAEQLFYVVTWTSDVSNRPQILKYRDIFNIENPDHHRSIIYNNINNTPENREVIILVESIILLRRTLVLKSKKITEIIDNKSNEQHTIEKNKEAQETKNILSSNLFSNFFISPYQSINHRYIRLIELDFRASQFRHLIRDVLDLGLIFERTRKEDEIKTLKEKILESKITKENVPNFASCADNSWPLTKEEQLIRFAVKEAIFCLREVIRSTHIYGLGNFISYSFLARTHERLGFWCQAFRNLNKVEKLSLSDINNKIEEYEKEIEKLKESLKIEKNKKDITEIKTNIRKYSEEVEKEKERYESLDGQKYEKEIEKIIGNSALAYLEPNYHFEEAIQHYHKSIQMHREGRVYKNGVLNLYMLEDDYNDNLKHFVLALERFRVNSGRVRFRINELKELVKDSKVYNYNSYHSLWNDSNN